jgi:hypothetical protein
MDYHIPTLRFYGSRSDSASVINQAILYSLGQQPVATPSHRMFGVSESERPGRIRDNRPARSQNNNKPDMSLRRTLPVPESGPPRPAGRN